MVHFTLLVLISNVDTNLRIRLEALRTLSVPEDVQVTEI
jgi:hypothetical protein